MRKILIIISIFVIAVSISAGNTYSVDTGTSNYGIEIDDYKIVYKTSKTVFAERNLWDLSVGWTDYYYYYTYYMYDKLKVVPLSISNDKFQYSNGNVSGNYETVLNYSDNRELSFGVGFENMNQSVMATIKFYQSWEYRYSEGEEVTFNLDGYSGYASTLLVSLNAKIMRRTYLVEKKYGNAFQGNAFLGNNIVFTPNSEETKEFIWDYDMVPLYWIHLSNTQKSLFTNYILQPLKKDSLNLSNLKSVYLERLPNELTEYYY